MKLAEALILRADYKTHIEQLRKRILNNSKVQEGEKPSENPQELLEELDETLIKLRNIIQCINKTNSLTRFDENNTLADILAERDRIWDKRTILNQLVESATVKQDRYSKSEVKFYSTINVSDIQKQIYKLSKEFREIDTKIQQKNWTIDLLNSI